MANHQSGHLGPALRGDRLSSTVVNEPPTVVSLTPLALEADSRTFRIAHSLADFGMRSIAIEGRPSTSRFWGPEIEVRSPGGAQRPNGVASRPHQIASALRSGRLGQVGELALYAGFRAYDWWRHNYQIQRLLPPAELYYLHSFELHRIVAPLAARIGARVIYDAHDFYRAIEPIEQLRPFDRALVRPFLNTLEDQLVAEADAVVTVSERVALLMEGAFGRRPAVIRNCHDERLDRAGERDLRAALGLTAEHRLCVVVGNWKPGMAVALAADAIALLPEHFHLAFVGRGYSVQAERFSRHPAASRLHFGHIVEPVSIVPFIRSADLGLVLYEPYSENYRGALPNGFFQIIAAGLPLVRLSLDEIEAAIAGAAVGICLEAAKPTALAGAILRCIENQRTFRRNAAWLAQRLSWEYESVKLRQLIGDLLGRLAPEPTLSPRDRQSASYRLAD
jgi:glycosyltransferase involved in cell wall biosynthesis